MKITLSLPTGINSLYKQGKHGWYKDIKAVNWQQEALWIIKSLKIHIPVYATSIYIKFYRKDKRIWDIDSGLKLLIDTLVKGKLIKDDSQITFLQVEKLKGKANYCEVELQ